MNCKRNNLIKAIKQLKKQIIELEVTIAQLQASNGYRGNGEQVRGVNQQTAALIKR